MSKTDWTAFVDAAESIRTRGDEQTHLIYPDGTFEVFERYSIDAPDTPEDLLQWEGKDDEERDVITGAQGWSIAEGMSGAFRYDGPLMHESEFFSPGILSCLMWDRDAPLLVATAHVADYSPEAYDEGEEDSQVGEVFSWVTLYREPETDD